MVKDGFCYKVKSFYCKIISSNKLSKPYAKGKLGKLSKDLMLLHGKGFSESNDSRMRQFYVVYPIYATVSLLV